MASELEFEEPAGTIGERGQPNIAVTRNIETVANVYPGRELAQGTDEYDVKVNSGVLLPIGYASYELTSPTYRKDETSTIYTVLDKIVVVKGQGHVYRAKLPASTMIDQGDLVVNWSAGCVYPAVIINGKTCVKIPWTGSDASTLVATGCVLVAKMCVNLPYIYCTTFSTSGTIDVGIGQGSETAYDVDGFALAVPVAATGLASHSLVSSTSVFTVGNLLRETNFIVGTDDSSSTISIPSMLEPGYIVSTAVTVDYTPSSIASSKGFILLPVSHPNLHIIGKCVKAKDNSGASTAADVLIQRVF